MEDEYPKCQRFVRQLEFNGTIVKAMIEKPEDGRYFIDYLDITEPGQRPSRYTPREESHETLAGVDEEIRRLVTR